MLKLSLHTPLLVAEPQKAMTRPHAIELLNALTEALQTPGIRDFVLDLGAVDSIDDSGLGSVVQAATNARASGQHFYLYRPSPVVMKTLHELEIDGFFPLLEYEEDLLSHMPD